MLDDIGLIQVKDLPLTEVEEVDVLCVENGEFKRKSASNLSGKEELDAVITGSVEINDNGEISSSFMLTKGNFESLKTKILSNQLPKILLIADAPEGLTMFLCMAVLFNTNENTLLTVFSNCEIIIMSDNTISLM